MDFDSIEGLTEEEILSIYSNILEGANERIADGYCSCACGYSSRGPVAYYCGGYRANGYTGVHPSFEGPGAGVCGSRSTPGCCSASLYSRAYCW